MFRTPEPEERGWIAGSGRVGPGGIPAAGKSGVNDRVRARVGSIVAHKATRRSFAWLALAPLLLLSACSLSIVSGGGQASYPQPQGYYGPGVYPTTKPAPTKSHPKANTPKAPSSSTPKAQPKKQNKASSQRPKQDKFPGKPAQRPAKSDPGKANKPGNFPGQPAQRPRPNTQGPQRVVPAAVKSSRPAPTRAVRGR